MKAKDVTVPKNDNLMQVFSELVIEVCDGCDGKGTECAGCIVGWYDARAWKAAKPWQTFSPLRCCENRAAFAKEMAEDAES